MGEKEPVRRRVAVTGLGLVTPLGTGVGKNWEALVAGRSGIGPITRFDTSDLPVKIAGEVKDFRPEEFIEKRDIKKMDVFIQYALAAARMAVEDANLRIEPANWERVGVLVGVGMGGILTLEEFIPVYVKTGVKKISPFFISRVIANLAPAQVAIHLGARGTNLAATSACASGGHAIGEAFRIIRDGYQDVMIAGGSEAALCSMSVGGFAAMRALSTRNEDPPGACCPFDRRRDGFVIAEGSGMMVLEELEAALARGARIYAELVGYGSTSDAFHITIPAPEGEGAARCMANALADAAMAPESIDYINAHGTSTPYNDVNETQAIKKIFGEHARRLAVSSTKSMTGHTLGAAGGIEAVYTALALYHGIIPPTINYREPDPECDLDYVPNEARRAGLRAALSNSFGFGGTNACLAFRRWS